MWHCVRGLLAATVLLAAGAATRADPAADAVAAQKKSAEENWEQLDAGPAAHLETRHLLVYAPKAMEKRLRDAGTLLEKHYDLARAALRYGPTEEAWPGKLTVYLLADPGQLVTFIRRVEKRRPDGDETGSAGGPDRQPHAAAAPPEMKNQPSLEARAGEQVAGALLVHKAGARNPMPGWLVAGFGRATTHRAMPRDRTVLDERRRAAALARAWSAHDSWQSGGLEPADAPVLQASVADYLAYGPAKDRFEALVFGFIAEAGMNMGAVPPADAFKAAGLDADAVDRGWKAWVGSVR